MPFGLPSAALVFQHRMRDILEAREARQRAILAEMEMHLQEPPRPPEPPEAQGEGVS